MFLATKELKYSKTKFALIIAVVVLISYLVYFLTSLAYGLASSYTNAVNKWDANEVIITIDSNDNMMMSYLTEDDFNMVDTNGVKAKLGLFPGVISDPTSSNPLDTRIDVYFFGIENDSFLKPLESNNLILEGNKVIADQSLEKSGYKVGDILTVTGTTLVYEIIGFSQKSTYQTAPVIYMNLSSWQEYRYGTANPPNLFSGIIVKGETVNVSNNLALSTVKEYINTLPGYTAQVLTFTTMIVFLIIIVSIVLSIFIYVLTIQKTSMFGVMKAQGISNFYIGSSVVFQTLVLVAIGIFTGLLLTIISGLFLANTIPFAINILFYLVITAAFFIFAMFGALFSVNNVLKIDPLKAIGG